MLRPTILVSLAGLALGCAAAPAPELVLNDPLRPSNAGADRAAPAPEASTPWTAPVAASAEPSPPPFRVPLRRRDDLHEKRFTVKGGYYSAEDSDVLDDGWIVNVAWSRYVTEIFALELEVGYFDADGNSGGVNADAWGIPIMVNGRLNVPVWLVDVYGGVGVGTIYFQADAFDGLSSLSADGFLLAGNAFVGATVNLLDKLAVGVEAKYYLTEEDADLGNTALDAFAVMGTVGFAF